MDGLEGTEAIDNAASTEAVESVGAPGPEATAGETPAQQPTGINPAWLPLRDAIGEDFFEQHAHPILKGMDESANTRITNLNAELKNYEGFKPFIERGVTPDLLEQAMGLVQLVESDPQGFYNTLGQYLGQGAEGEQESLEEFGDGQENTADLPPHVQQQLEQALQFQQQFIQQQQQQQQEAAYQQQVEEEGQLLDREMSEFLQKNPSFTEEDKADLFRIQFDLSNSLAQRGIQRIATLDEAAQVLREQHARYARRFGGNGAPQTLPTTTGGNIPGQQPDVKKMSNQDFMNLIANDIAAANAANQS